MSRHGKSRRELWPEEVFMNNNLQAAQNEAPTDIASLDELLSRPTPGLIETLRGLDGDIMVLGVGGKMGPTLARMARRALDELGRKDKVIGVARFSNSSAQTALDEVGVQTIRCDLLDAAALQKLPEAANVVFMAGQKFGTSSGPELTWAMNTLVPANVAQRFPRSRTVVFSTGCVYPLSSVLLGGSIESDALGPPGDYANSCVGRERIFTYYSNKNRTPVCLYRLNYAIDLRYGVLHDVATKVFNDEPVDVTMGRANVIWQGDANAQALQCLAHASSPPTALNVTGPETISLRALARELGRWMEKDPTIVGEEAPTAWLSNAARAAKLFGYPQVSLAQMTQWTAQWIQQGGASLGKPTHFEERSGKF
jgi:nucleoside-diphosphate-sugar epimerase